MPGLIPELSSAKFLELELGPLDSDLGCFAVRSSPGAKNMQEALREIPRDRRKLSERQREPEIKRGQQGGKKERTYRFMEAVANPRAAPSGVPVIPSASARTMDADRKRRACCERQHSDYQTGAGKYFSICTH